MVHGRLNPQLVKRRVHPDRSGHGRVYVGILLRLVDLAMGEDAGELLRQAFRGQKVKWVEWDANAYKARTT